MKRIVHYKLVVFSLLGIFLDNSLVFAESRISFVIKTHDPISLYSVKNGKKNAVVVSKEIIRATEGVYTNVSLDDLDGDGVDEIVMTFQVDGGVNRCSKIYRYNQEKNSIAELAFSGGDICNYRKEDDYLVSSYRSGAAWSEDVYRFDSGRVKTVYKDSCIGCGAISRKVYSSSGTVTDYMVSDRQALKNRRPIVFEVSSKKAAIFDSPQSIRPSRKYLVRGDKLFVIGFDEIESDVWVKFRFLGEVVTEGWVRCADLVRCEAP